MQDAEHEVRSLIQLDPPLHLVTPLGKANAHFLLYIDDDHYAVYGCFQEATGENWWWLSKHVRLDTSVTGGHTNLSPIAPVGGLEEHIGRHQAKSRPFTTQVLRDLCGDKGRSDNEGELLRHAPAAVDEHTQLRRREAHHQEHGGVPYTLLPEDY